MQADVLARHRRLRGQPVRFLTGTDENAARGDFYRRSYVLSFVRAGLTDISVSRPAERSAFC